MTFRLFAACLPVCALLMAGSVQADAVVQGKGEAQSASSQVSEPQEARSAAPAPGVSALKNPSLPDFTPPVAMVRHLASRTELPALQLSLALVNFVGETNVDNLGPNESAYAILPCQTSPFWKCTMSTTRMESWNFRLLPRYAVS